MVFCTGHYDSNFGVLLMVSNGNILGNAVRLGLSKRVRMLTSALYFETKCRTGTTSSISGIVQVFFYNFKELLVFGL